MKSDKTRDEKKLSLRNTLIAVVVTLFFVGIIFMYYTMLYSEKRSNIIKSGEMTAKESADHIDHYLQTNIDAVNLAAFTLDEMLTEHRTDKEIQDYLVGQSTAVRSAVIENMTGLYGYINGRFFSGTRWEPPADYVATDRPWYTKPMENPGELTILDPYVDVQSGNVMLALGKTLCDGESVISVDVSLDQIQKLTEDAVRSGESDAEMLLNNSCTVVAHSDKDEIGKNYNEEIGTFGAEIVKKVDGTDDHYFEFSFDDADYVVYVADLQNGWHCVSVKDATNVFGSLNSILLITITVVVIIVVIISIIMTRSNRYLHMSARAIAANEAKSSFLSNMSHEIRTPINAMLGMNEMILRESDEQSIITYSENIKAAGKNLLGLVNDILDFSKIEAGKMEIIPVDYDLSAVVNDLANMIHNRAEDKGLIFRLKIDKNIPRLLHGDEVRIKQVIANLLTNAVKYTEKGSVTLYMGYRKLNSDPDNILLTVSVKDTGIGIKEEDMQKLFSKFERIEEDRNRNIEGTGLGMGIAGNLLEMMGSKLNVESVYGLGSTFSFSVKQQVQGTDPIGDYEESYRESLAQKDRYHEKFSAPDACILVVDDNPMNLMVFKSLVKQTGVKTDTANSGDEGISLTRNKLYDLIFLDHMMPEKDGIETLHEIREDTDNQNRNTPSICLTANAISGAREKYISAGFDDYLTKPIDPDTLEEMMLAYLPKDKIQKRQAGIGEYEETGSGNMESMNSILSAISIDTDAGLKNSGTMDSYMSLLKIFYESIDEKTEELNRFFKEDDLKNYTIKVHALKSSARIIGAADFGEKAQRLEDAGKADDIGYIRGHHVAFMTDYESFREPLSKVFSGYDDTVRPEADPDIIEGVLEEIKAAAEDMDCERLDSIFEEMSEYSIPQDSAKLYENLKDASDRYEYKKIVELLSGNTDGAGE